MLGAAVTSTPPKHGKTPFGNGSPSAKTVACSYRPSPSRSSSIRIRPEVVAVG